MPRRSIERGYGDAVRYMDSMAPEGVPLEPEATVLLDTTPGIAFREAMAGPFALGEADPREGAAKGKSDGTKLTMHAAIDIEDIRGFVADSQHGGGLTGSIDFPGLRRSTFPRMRVCSGYSRQATSPN